MAFLRETLILLDLRHTKADIGHTTKKEDAAKALMTPPALLVTTSTAVLLVEGGRSRAVHTGEGIYFGLTWDRDFVYVLCRNNLAHGRLRRLFGYRVTMEVLDKSFRRVDSIPCPSIHDPHQAIERQGSIYVANTGRDRIEVYRDGAFSSIDWTGEGKDVHHINTVWFDDTSFYALENNKQEQSIARVFDFDWRATHDIPLGLGAHNILRQGQTLVVCSSLDRAMLRYDLDEEATAQFSLLGKNWLPRGLSKGKDRFHIGLSAEGTRSERHGGMPGKLICTDEEFEIIDTIDLEGAGQVNEVRLISELDAAHNGVPF